MGLVPQRRIVQARRGEWLVERRSPQPLGIRRPDVHHGMVHVLPARRPNFGELDPLVFRETGGNDFVGVLDVAGGGNGDRLRHLDHAIRFRNVPALGPARRRRRIVRITWLSCVGPGGEGGNLFVVQRRIISEMSATGIGEPGRHTPGANVVTDQPGPRFRLLVGDQRHGRDFARAVTSLAMLLKNGEHVAIKRRRGWRGLLRGAHGERPSEAEHQQRRCELTKHVESGF